MFVRQDFVFTMSFYDKKTKIRNNVKYMTKTDDGDDYYLFDGRVYTSDKKLLINMLELEYVDSGDSNIVVELTITLKGQKPLFQTYYREREGCYSLDHYIEQYIEMLDNLDKCIPVPEYKLE